MAYLAARQFLALIILDSWVFWTHYLEHTVPWLYRKFNLLPDTHTHTRNLCSYCSNRQHPLCPPSIVHTLLLRSIVQPLGRKPRC